MQQTQLQRTNTAKSAKSSKSANTANTSNKANTNENIKANPKEWAVRKGGALPDTVSLGKRFGSKEKPFSITTCLMHYLYVSLPVYITIYM